MAVEIVMPRLGWTMEKGTLVEWSKGHEEEISAGEIVMLVESDKAVNEVEVFDSGIIHIPADSPPVGSVIPVGTVMAYILEPGEAPPAPGSAAVAPTLQAATAWTANATSAVTATPSTDSASVEPRRRPVQPVTRRPSRNGPTISPRARRVAIELGVDWKSLRGSGLTGRIVERDVRHGAAQARTPHSSYAASIAVEVDATEFVQLHEKLSASRHVAAEEAPETADLLVKLAAVALAQHGAAGIARINETGGMDVSRGVVAGSGLAYPVIRDAATKSLRQIAADSRGFQEDGDPIAAATATASVAVIDMGPYGVDSFQPVLIPGQRAALAAGRTVSRAGDGGERQIMTLGLTYDAQELDGVAVSSFLSTVRDFIEQPFHWLTW